MEAPKEDPTLKDINSLFNDGFVGFMFPEGVEDISDRPERVRQTYANSWSAIQNFLFDPCADWTTREKPIDKLLGIHSRIYDMEDMPNMAPYLHVAYMGMHNETTDHMINGILFDNVPKGTYPIDSIRYELERIILEIDASVPGAEIVQSILSAAYSLHFAKIFKGEGGVPNRFDIEMAFMDYLSEYLDAE